MAMSFVETLYAMDSMLRSMHKDVEIGIRPLTASEAIGRRICLARLKAGYTQRELASVVGISKLRLVRLETGESGQPGTTQLLALAVALRVSESWLLVFNCNIHR